MGSCLIRERRHSHAIDCLEEALNVRVLHSRNEDLPTSEIFFNMGIIYCETGKLHKAVDCYEQAIQIKIKELGNQSIEVAQVSIALFKKNLLLHRLLKYTFC